jgi:hypothetical protein
MSAIRHSLNCNETAAYSNHRRISTNETLVVVPMLTFQRKRPPGYGGRSPIAFVHCVTSCSATAKQCLEKLAETLNGPNGAAMPLSVMAKLLTAAVDVDRLAIGLTTERTADGTSPSRPNSASPQDSAFRFHDLRHTCITKLAESQASDMTIMAIAGHVSKRMLGTLQPHPDGRQARSFRRNRAGIETGSFWGRFATEYAPTPRCRFRCFG